MSVGGVGAAGGSAGSAAGAGAAAGGGVSPTGGPSGGEGVSSPAGGEASTKDISDAGDKSGPTYNISINQTQNNSMFSSMSTQDSVQLYSCVNKPAESNEMDLQKLIEMMMIMKLLESMNENQSSGFSTTA